MNETDLKFWNDFYSELEKGLTNYVRPENWKERAAKAESRRQKPILNQQEGLKRPHKAEG